LISGRIWIVCEVWRSGDEVGEKEKKDVLAVEAQKSE
jgi:hypothetical protein